MIDFQLSSVHRRRGKLFRVATREDLRHLLKQKRAFTPHLLTPAERNMLAHKSLPSRIWMATGKKPYNFVTRRLMNWSDSEGSENRVEKDGPAIRKALLQAGARDVAFAAYALPADGFGIYAFVEGDLSACDLPQSDPKPNLAQIVTALPRDAEGRVRTDLLELIASNRLDELEQLLGDAPELADMVKSIASARLNLTDRRLR